MNNKNKNLKNSILVGLFLCSLAILGLSFTSKHSIDRIIKPGETYKKLDSLEVTVNKKTYWIHKGDTAQLGYGSGENGTFVYIFFPKGQIKEPLSPLEASKKAVVKRIFQFKNQNSTFLKISVNGAWYEAYIPQCLDKKEIVGFNQVKFYED